MAAFILSEEAEHTLLEADHALSALETAFAALGEAQLECRRDELAALLALVRRPLAPAREQARSEALAG
ncbi:hypothetical protein [Tibeticola sp.]|uniref:hypothetical protein n=1 Tax=Tibeticola sp. TaxID=2005368 RepID=UPI0025D77B25|nr:hypothetical protein [Tibeticola sp.]